MEAGRRAMSSYVYPVGASVARLPIMGTRSRSLTVAIKVRTLSMGLGGIFTLV